MPRWLFYVAVVASWLLGAEIVVLTAARRSLPGRLPTFAGWLFVAAIAVSVAAMVRLEMMGRQETAKLVDHLEATLSSITELTEASLSSLELPEMLDRFLERLVNVLHADVGAIFLLSDAGAELRSIAVRGVNEANVPALTVFISDNDGLVGRVVVTEVPIASNNERDLAILSERTGLHLKSAAACPILVEGRLIGVCVAATSSSKEFDERELHLVQLVADRSGLGIERKRLDEAETRARLDAERGRRYAIVLATASAALATAREHYHANLASLVDAVVPSFSDWCAINVADGAGNLQPLAIRHVTDRSDLCRDELRQRIPLIDEMAARAVENRQTQRSAGFRTMHSARATRHSRPPTIDPTPWIIVPIIAEADIIGTFIFAFDGGASVINSDMIATAEDIARRAAIAIDRVLFYQEAQEIAEHSSRVANQLQQLLDALLEMSHLIDDSSVIAAIAGRALAICDANGAVVTIGKASQPNLRAISEQGKFVRIGGSDLTAAAIDFPIELESLATTTRFGGLLATPIMGASGAPLGSMAIWRDNAPHFSNEDETVLVLLAQTTSTALSSVELYRTIQASEVRWRTLIETAPIGVMEVDVHGTVQWANRSAQEIFDGTGASMVGGASGEVIERANVSKLAPLWARAAIGVEVRDRELIGVRIGGESRDLLVSVVPLYSTNRTVQGILTLVADISDRRRLEGELQQAQRMDAVGRLAGNVAHDFNNLLTLISGYTELLRSHRVMDERQLDLVNSIQGVTDRAALLTGRLLTISRQQSPRPEVIDPIAALGSMREVLGKILGERVELVYEFGDEKARVSIDPGYFDQVILNLAVNARDAMPEGGTFTISLHRQHAGPSEIDRLEGRVGEMFELVVSDTGVGMDAMARERCFEPFFTTKGPTKGTGLGLAAVHSVVVECGGTIQVRSTPGIGTSFIVDLPLAAIFPEESSTAQHEVARVNHANASILIAEDDDTLRTLICKVLTQAGYYVLSAAAGDLALEVAKSWTGTLDLLITDVAMPGMNGPDLANRIREFTPGIPVLFISSNTAGTVVPPDEAERVSFLPKPFRPSELVERVSTILDAHAEQRKKNSQA